MFTIHIYRLGNGLSTWVVEAIHTTHDEYSFCRSCNLRDLGETILAVLLDKDITERGNGSYHIKEWCFA